MHEIVFEVNLETVSRNSHAPAQTLRSEGDYFKNTRSTWFPNNIMNNRQLVDGNQFTVYNEEALYLKNNFTEGDDAFLSVVSEGLVFTS